jgi:hypothetical protein
VGGASVALGPQAASSMPAMSNALKSAHNIRFFIFHFLLKIVYYDLTDLSIPLDTVLCFSLPSPPLFELVAG